MRKGKGPDLASGAFVRAIVLQRDRVDSFAISTSPPGVPSPNCIRSCVWCAARGVSGMAISCALKVCTTWRPTLMTDHVQHRGSQFIVATHSPILMAYPDATIYELSIEHGIQSVKYEDTDHFLITRDFLNDRQSFFNSLFNDT